MKQLKSVTLFNKRTGKALAQLTRQGNQIKCDPQAAMSALGIDRFDADFLSLESVYRHFSRHSTMVGAVGYETEETARRMGADPVFLMHLDEEFSK